MKNLFYFAMLMSFLAVPAFAQEQPKAEQPAPENPNAPEFKFEAEEYDFGTIKQGDKVTYTFNFTNTGKEPLIISEAFGSCGCTVPEYPKQPIPKGQKGTIKVTFNSAGKMGGQDKTVTLRSNAKTKEKVLHIKGTVTQPDPAPAAPATPADSTHNHNHPH